MIAAAMPKRNPSAPAYLDLCKSGSVLEREVEARSLARLVVETEAIHSVNAKLNFEFDDRARPIVNGNATVQLGLGCHRCPEIVPLTLEATVQGLLASSEAQAIAWQEQTPDRNIIVVAGAELDISELIEDELLLKLPWRVCVEEGCNNLPQLAYAPTAVEIANANKTGHESSGAASGADTDQEKRGLVDSPARKENPFAVLAKLKDDFSTDKP